MSLRKIIAVPFKVLTYVGIVIAALNFGIVLLILHGPDESTRRLNRLAKQIDDAVEDIKNAS